jgi:superfamily I DNA/RNA helicase
MIRPFIPSPAQARYFDWLKNGRGNAILVAVAGSGKTTTLLKGLPYMPGTVGYFAFNNSIASEIAEKLIAELQIKPGEKARAVGKTLHSYGYTHLKWAFPHEKLALLKGNHDKTNLLLDDYVALNPLDTELVMAARPTVCKMVSMAKQRGLGALVSASDRNAWIDMVDRYDLAENLPEDMDVWVAIKFAQNMLLKGNDRLDVIDFDDMIYLPLQKRVRFTWRFDWVLVDEAQDTNPTRRALAMKALKPGGRFVAVGDDRQAIYGFTGADNDALDQIAEALDCIRLPLTVSYRCPQNVVAHARNWVSHIEAHESAPEGSVTTEEYDQATQSVALGDAMLCRYNKPLVQTCFKLIRAGKAAKIEGRDIGQGLIAFTKRWKVKTLDALRSRLETHLAREVAKAQAKNDAAKADSVTDKVETLYVLIEKCLAEGKNKVTDLVDTINSMFEDKVSDKGNVVVLASVHKSKGLEWSKVYILGREQFMPSPFAKQEWQIEQENNLIYVAITRAKLNLVEVTMPAKEQK